MKKILVLLMVLAMVMAAFSGCTPKEEPEVVEAPDSLQAIMDKGEFVLGLDDSFPPMGFRDDNGEIVGFDIDLAKEVASRMGIEVVLKPVDWDGIALSLKNGDIDVIWNGLTITDERKETMGFTKPYLNNRQIIIVRLDSDIAAKADLEDKVVGVQLGSSSDIALNDEAAVAEKLKDIRKYSNNVEALLDLANEGTDAVVVDEIVGRYYIAKKPDMYKVLDDYFTDEEYGVAYRKEDTAFGEELDRILDEMKADGAADAISEEWFGEAIVVK
ncbi:MAG: amino acid ABC transporter substrate-binding protein [Peptostreptococcaceae bacterium]|nr:amino acid ABC transporter substrate-binding protein [Peptostreptococcaceae bacterium]